MQLAALELALGEWAACSEPGADRTVPLAVLDDPMAVRQLAEAAAKEADTEGQTTGMAQAAGVPGEGHGLAADGRASVDPAGRASPSGRPGMASGRVQGVVRLLEVVHVRCALRLGLLELDTLERQTHFYTRPPLHHARACGPARVRPVR